MSGSGSPGLPAGNTHARTPLSPAQTIQAHGCSIVLRCVNGPDAKELYFNCRPAAGTTDPGLQAEAVYRAVQTVLNTNGGSAASIISETVFHRDLPDNLELVREARRRVMADNEEVAFGPAMTEIEQPSLDAHVWLELSIHAMVPIETIMSCEPVSAAQSCDCAECARSQGLMTRINGETRFHSGALYGFGDDAYEQTLAVFGAAEKMLQQAGMHFGDVVRTWIYLHEMDRDYPDLNRARREFFDQRSVNPPPASTGIGAGLVPGSHVLCLSVYAATGGKGLQKTVMTTPTLNEAPQYGADFSRGMRVTESNKETLYVSGTASLNEAGETVHVGDFDAQVDRMLLNVAALLDAQGCSFDDVASAITYIKHPADARRLEEKLEAAGYTGFANTLVVAPVCRAELLCETEALAIVRIDR